MAGKIHKMIREIIEKKAKGNRILMNTVETKLILKGINPEKYSPSSPDDPVILEKVKIVAKEFGINLI